MATSIIRGVAAAGKCRHGISNCNCQQVLVQAHSVSVSTNSLYQTPPTQLSPIAEENREAIYNYNNNHRQANSGNAYLSVSCVRQSAYSFEDGESFQTANISTSTAYAGSEDSVVVVGGLGLKQQQQQPDALGVLKIKESPIKCLSRNLNKSISCFPLRTKTPFYARQILTAEDLLLETQQLAKSDSHLFEKAVMRSGNIIMGNGSAHARPKRNLPTVGLNAKLNKTHDINHNRFMRNGTIMTSANTEKREHLYKILVIGELGTGKTSFIKRYVHQFFSQNYRATIGVDFALKVLHWDANTIVRLQLWDIAGQERFGNMTRVYYKEAVGAFIVFDVTRSATFDCVSKWKEDLDSKVQLPDGSPIPCILLANKCDQDKQGVVTSPEKMEEYVRDNGFAGWYETSAKENINIDEAARSLVNKILLNDKLINAADLADSERFNLNSTADQISDETKNKCAC